MFKTTNDAGEEIEVYTADDVNARVTEAVTQKENEFKPQITELTEKLTDAETRARERAGEFAQFRKLSDEQVAKLGAAERTIYENGLALQQERERSATLEKQAKDAAINTALRAKAGTNDKLFQKMKEMWPVINVEANTPEQIEAKTAMVLGAISVQTPDLLASVAGFSGGSFLPPKNDADEGKSYADTEAGKAAAAELGLITEAPKK